MNINGILLKMIKFFKQVRQVSMFEDTALIIYIENYLWHRFANKNVKLICERIVMIKSGKEIVIIFSFYI